MGFQDDWMLRQVDMLASFVAHVLFGKDTIQYETENSEELKDIYSLKTTDLLYFTMQKLIKEGKIDKAEDMLFENIDYTDNYVKLATDFYKNLNLLSDTELKNGNFSREEIFEGFIDILEKLKVPVDEFKI